MNTSTLIAGGAAVVAAALLAAALHATAERARIRLERMLLPTGAGTAAVRPPGALGHREAAALDAVRRAEQIVATAAAEHL